MGSLETIACLLASSECNGMQVITRPAALNQSKAILKIDASAC